MERSQTLFERVRPGRAIALIAIAGAIAGGIKHCASPIPESAGNTSSARYDRGLITKGANIRTAPERTESQSDTSSNACAQATETIPFSADVTIEDNPHSANGAWVGIPLEALSEDVQEQCDDAARESTVWIAQSLITKG